LGKSQAVDLTSAGDLRFLTYSHDGFGLGHFRRSLRVATSLAGSSPGASILAATGSAAPQYLRLPAGVDYLKIPSVAKMANGHYVPRSLAVPVLDLLDVRSALLASAITSFRPDLVLVDRYPVGLLGELRAGLESLKRLLPQTRLVLGLRDVIDDPASVRDEWMRGGYSSALEEFYDLVLIYGSRGVYDATEAYGFPASLDDRTVYTGYLCVPSEPSAAAKVRGKLRVNGYRLALCTVGGGEDGFGVASAFIEGMRLLGDEWAAVVITGPLMSREQVRELKVAARGGGKIRVRTFVDDLPAYLDAADVVVSMGGYNTLCEALSVGARSVVVPRTHPRTEQSIRSHLFAERGVLHVLEEADLNAGNLRDAMQTLVEVPRDEIRGRIRASFDLGGLERATNAMMDLLHGPNGDGAGGSRVIDLRAPLFAAREGSTEKAPS
jgi:predicted glycosyltransferase